MNHFKPSATPYGTVTDREAKIAAGQEVEEEAELMHSPGQRRIPSDPDSRVHRLYVAYHHLIKPHARKAKKQFPNRENWDLIDDLYHDEFIKALFRWVPRPGEPDERFENFCNTHLSQAPGRGRIPKDKRWLGGRGERIDDKDYWATLHSIADREISVRPQPPPAPVEEILAHLSPDDSKVIRMRFGIPPYEKAYEWKEIQTEMGFKDWQNGQDVIRRAKAKLTKLYPKYKVWGDYEEDQEPTLPDPSIVSPHTPASLTPSPCELGLQIQRCLWTTANYCCGPCLRIQKMTPRNWCTPTG